MAESAEGAGFWLPSEFFDDFQENLNITESDFNSDLCFPTEFPYDFDQKRWLMSTSPQSTLSQISSSTNGSPNVFPSPPTTPKNDAVGDLIYLAAGQVARLKLHSADASAPRSIPDPSIIPNIYLQQQQQMVKQKTQMWQEMHQMRMGQDAWSVLQNPTRIVGSDRRATVFSGVAAAKRSCAGTGVFLPRRFGNNNSSDCNAYSSDSRKRPGYSAPSIPNRNVHAMNKNLNCFTQSEPKLGRRFISEYDLLMARRNALLLQHRRSMLLEGSSPPNHSLHLPQEWTY